MYEYGKYRRILSLAFHKMRIYIYNCKDIRHYKSTTRLSFSITKQGRKDTGLVNPDDLMLSWSANIISSLIACVILPICLSVRSLIDLSILCALLQPQYQP